MHARDAEPATYLRPESITDGVVTLRELEVSDVSERYVGWLNDPEVNRWLETRWESQTRDAVREYVHCCAEDELVSLFGIFVGEPAQHIGNIKLGPVHPIHDYGDVSYFIGERAAWGNGYATRAVRLACGYGFRVFGLHRMQAGCYAANKASARVLLKAGFSREGERVRALKTEHGWDNELLFGRIAGGSAL